MYVATENHDSLQLNAAAKLEFRVYLEPQDLTFLCIWQWQDLTQQHDY